MKCTGLRCGQRIANVLHWAHQLSWNTFRDLRVRTQWWSGTDVQPRLSNLKNALGFAKARNSTTIGHDQVTLASILRHHRQGKVTNLWSRFISQVYASN